MKILCPVSIWFTGKRGFMTNQTQVSIDNRDIYFRTDGAINGDVVTVASFITWADDKSPIDDLTISDQFISGDYLAFGDLKATNQFYDKLTGIFWFDVKLKPITGPVNVILQTTGTVNGVQIPIRFEFDLTGPSPLVVSPILFNGNKMEFDITTSAGRLLRYPLSLLATRQIDGNAEALPSKEKKIPYSFYIPISNNSQDTYAVMGQVEVDGVKYNFVARTSVITTDGTISVSQIDENLMSVDIVLNKSNSHIGISLPLQFNLGNGTYGIVNQVKNFSVQDTNVHFEFLINDVKDQDTITLNFHLTEGDNQDAPIFFKGTAPIKRWSHGQTKINVVVDSHTFKRTLQSLYMSVYWEDGTPVTGFKVKDVTPSAEVGTKSNKIIIARVASLNIHQRNTLTLAGNIDLSAFGIEELVPFSESIDVGSDVLPARLYSGLGTINEDKVFLQLSVRQNNGDIFKDLSITSFNKISTIDDLHYDSSTGVVNFTAPKSAVTVIDDRGDIEIIFSLTSDQVYSFTYKGSIKIEVPYTVIAEKPLWKYRRDRITNQVSIDVTWTLRGNDGAYPTNATINQFKVNGVDTACTKRYNPGFGGLVASFSVDLKDGDPLFVDAVTTVSGLGSFLHLPTIDTKYRGPGKVTYIDHEFIEDKKVKVYFNVQGWNSEPPLYVQINDQSWNKQQGVKLGKTHSEYDSEKGVLMVVFDIYDINSSIFSASTEMKFDLADSTIYPISFSFTK